GSLARARHGFCVLGQDAELGFGSWRSPGGAAAGEFRVREVELEKLLLGVDGDLVAIVDQSERAADCSLGRNVADDHTVGSAGKAAVSDQSNRVAQSCADQR